VGRKILPRWADDLFHIQVFLQKKNNENKFKMDKNKDIKKVEKKLV
jgi:hypothetical protein